MSSMNFGMNSFHSSCSLCHLSPKKKKHLQYKQKTYRNIHTYKMFLSSVDSERCIFMWLYNLRVTKGRRQPWRSILTAKDTVARQKKRRVWTGADSASQSGCDTGKEFLTDGRSPFKKISWVQRDKVTHWQDICVCRSAATAAPSALSINNWFEPPKGSQGRYTCYKLEVVFPTQMKNCWIVSCDTQMSRQDFGKVFYLLYFAQSEFLLHFSWWVLNVWRESFNCWLLWFYTVQGITLIIC